MRSGVAADMPPRSLSAQQVVRLHQLLHDARFNDPRCGPAPGPDALPVLLLGAPCHSFIVPSAAVPPPP
jgi:hypothetical protein